jgi:hypothetical protein
MLVIAIVPCEQALALASELLGSWATGGEVDDGQRDWPC